MERPWAHRGRDPGDRGRTVGKHDRLILTRRMTTSNSMPNLPALNIIYEAATATGVQHHQPRTMQDGSTQQEKYTLPIVWPGDINTEDRNRLDREYCRQMGDVYEFALPKFVEAILPKLRHARSVNGSALSDNIVCRLSWEMKLYICKSLGTLDSLTNKDRWTDADPITEIEPVYYDAMHSLVSATLPALQLCKIVHNNAVALTSIRDLQMRFVEECLFCLVEN